MVHRCILLVAAFLLLTSSMVPQSPSRGFPTPPPSLDQEKQAPGQNPSTTARHSDLEQAQREAILLKRAKTPEPTLSVPPRIELDLTKISRYEEYR